MSQLRPGIGSMRTASNRDFSALFVAALVAAMASLAGLILLVHYVFAAEAFLEWNPNTEPDLAGYKIYQSTVSGQYDAPAVATVDKSKTSDTRSLPQLALEQTYYFILTAFDTSGNESLPSKEVSKTIAGIPAPPPVGRPGTPVLTVVALSPTSVKVSATPVDDGTGQPAKIALRYQLGPISWGTAREAICPQFPCVLSGLPPNTTIEVQAVAHRGTLNVDAVFGDLSAVVASMTMPNPVDPPPAAPNGFRITLDNIGQEVIILAKSADCPRISTSTLGSTKTTLKRTVKCVR